jgi:chorismate dehydratase
MSIVIGSVPYLNAKPLIRWFNTPEGRDTGIEVVEATPSELAAMLARNDIAVAMVSSYESFRHPEYRWVPGISISGQDEIKSVRAFSRLPFGMIHSIAMDSSSLTSVNLVTILLAELYNSHPQHLSMPPNLKRMLDQADAGLLIGDPGMVAAANGLHVLDVGKDWRKLTGLPFVYALWIGRPENITDQLAHALHRAKEWGMTQTDAIATEESARLSVDYSVCHDYIANVMDYDFCQSHEEALALFRAKCAEHGLLA